MSASPQPNAAALNNAMRALVTRNSLPMLQQIFSQTITPAAGQNVSQAQPVINIVPRMVGLIRGFWIKVVATVANGSAVVINATDFGPWNVLSQIQFTDLNNNIRVQTPGWHAGLVDSVKG